MGGVNKFAHFIGSLEIIKSLFGMLRGKEPTENAPPIVQEAYSQFGLGDEKASLIYLDKVERHIKGAREIWGEFEAYCLPEHRPSDVMQYDLVADIATSPEDAERKMDLIWWYARRIRRTQVRSILFGLNGDRHKVGTIKTERTHDIKTPTAKYERVTPVGGGNRNRTFKKETGGGDNHTTVTSEDVDVYAPSPEYTEHTIIWALCEITGYKPTVEKSGALKYTRNGVFNLYQKMSQRERHAAFDRVKRTFRAIGVPMDVGNLADTLEEIYNKLAKWLPLGIASIRKELADLDGNLQQSVDQLETARRQEGGFVRGLRKLFGHTQIN